MNRKQDKDPQSTQNPEHASRRAFLQNTAGALATAAVLGGCRDESEKQEGDGGPDSANMGQSTEPKGSDNQPEKIPSSRVVRVTDPTATTWDGDDAADFYQYAVQDVVDSMFEAGLKALTGQTTLEAAWQSLVPYSSGESVGVHVNAYANNSNDRKNNVAAPISSIVHGLVDVLGVPAENVIITDPSRTLQGSAAQERIINGCRHSESLGWDRFRGEWGADISFTAGHAPPQSEQIARFIEEIDHLIMVPVLSWHSFNWITGCMKMLMGSISNMATLHEAGSTDWRDGAVLADICMPAKNKVRLVAADGLFGNIHGNNNNPHRFETLGGGGGHPSSAIYLSKDMVAVDSVMYDDLLDEARAEGSPKSGFRYGYLSYAADTRHGLGTFEMREDSGASTYSKINLVAIDR